MFFEKCLNCTPNEWQPIDPNQLRVELSGAYATPDETIDLILIHNAVAKTTTASYRRGKPTQPVKDWAKVQS